MFDIASSLSNRVNWQFLAIVKSYVKFNKLMKQEAHGPHRSPKKPQFKSINTYDYIITLIKKRKQIIYFMKF